MEKKLFNYAHQNIIYIIFLFLISDMFAISSTQINLNNINMESQRTYNVLNTTYDYYKKITFDRPRDKIDEEIIIINTSAYFSGIFTFSPKKFLQSLYTTDAADYFKDIPGFNCIRNGGTNSDLVFRGMGGSRIRVLVNNGEVLGACCARMDPASSYIYPGTFDILNVVKGPQTVLLGPVSSVGTLQFERYHPRFDISQCKLHSNITLGSNNKMDKNIDSIIGGKYGYIRLIGNISCSDNYRDGNGYRVHSAWYKWNADAILSLNVNSKTSCEINLGQGNGCANYFTKIVDGLCFARESYSLKLETIDISNIIDKIELHTWYNYVDHLMGNDIQCHNIYASPKQCNFCVNNHVARYVWGVRGMVMHQWKNMDYHSGIDLQINQHRKMKCDVHWVTDLITQDAGVFSELTINTLSNSKLIGGMRLEYYNVFNMNNSIYKRYNTIYPAGFIRYEMNTDPLLYYIGLGTGKRFPDYWELLHINFNKCMHMKNGVFNKTLKAERTVQIDTGMCFQYYKIDGWVSSYIGYIKNFILSNYNDVGGTKNNINSVNNIDARICGMETELNYVLNKYWCIKNNVTWNWGLNLNNGCSLPRIPPLAGTLTCQWKYGYYNMVILWKVVTASRYEAININVSQQMNSKSYIKNPGFGIISINLMQIFSKYYVLNIGIDNIFNRNYTEYFNLFHHQQQSISNGVNTPIHEPGRVWWIKAEILL